MWMVPCGTVMAAVQRAEGLIRQTGDATLSESKQLSNTGRLKRLASNDSDSPLAMALFVS